MLFRCLISEQSPELEGEPWQVLWVYFELATAHEPAPLVMAQRRHRVLHGGLTLDAFMILLEAWAADEPAAIAGWSLLPPPEINTLHRHGPWSSDSDLWRIRVLAPMPQSDAPYLVERLEGSGSQMDVGADYNPLVSRMVKTRDTREAWMRDFMHESVGDQIASRLVIEMPVPVAISTTIDHGTLDVTIDVRYRVPNRDGSFEVRVGKEPWVPDRSILGCQETVAETDAWWRTRFHTRLDAPGDYTIWVTRPHTDEDFDWRLPIQVGDSNPWATRVRDMIDVWFDLNHPKQAPTLARALEPQPVTPAKGNKARYFEVALHAVCTALGMPTFYGDQTLQTPGVDILAFDWSEKLAFAISATKGTDIDRKLTEWVAVRRRISEGLEPDWTVRPIIITSQRLADCNHAHIETAYHQDVMVLGAEDLECLRGATPDVAAFGRTLRLRLVGGHARERLVPAQNAESGYRVVDLI